MLIKVVKKVLVAKVSYVMVEASNVEEAKKIANEKLSLEWDLVSTDEAATPEYEFYKVERLDTNALPE